MKISYNWLKEYLKTNLSVDEMSSLLTGSGLEVESIEDFETIKGGLRGLVIGEVLEKTKHPGADRLSVTKVNANDNISIGLTIPNTIKFSNAGSNN